MRSRIRLPDSGDPGENQSSVHGRSLDGTPDGSLFLIDILSIVTDSPLVSYQGYARLRAGEGGTSSALLGSISECTKHGA